MTARLFRLLVVLSALLGASVGAWAQLATPETIDSLDAKVLGAKAIVVGTVASVVENDGTREWPREVTFNVRETLKGEASDFAKAVHWGALAQVEAWKAGSARILVFVPEGAEGAYGMQAIDLDDPGLLVSKADFTLIRKPDALVRYVRVLVAKNGAAVRKESFVVPPDGPKGKAWLAALAATKRYRDVGGLRVPVDERLERWARDAIRPGPVNRRVVGAHALAFYRSEENVARLRALLRDPQYVLIGSPEAQRGIERRHYRVREAAHQTLRTWGIEVETPTTFKEVSVLDRVTSLQLYLPQGSDIDIVRNAPRLTSLTLFVEGGLTYAQLDTVASLAKLTHLTLPEMGLNDAKLAHLAPLRNLRALDLQMNGITDAGLATISAFPRLEQVWLEDNPVTQTGLAALRRAHPRLRFARLR